MPARLREVNLRAGLEGAGFVGVKVRERAHWREAGQAMWTEAAALDPRDDPTLTSFHEEGVRSIAGFDRVRRVMASAVRPSYRVAQNEYEKRSDSRAPQFDP